jgi:hypothetical protein
MWKHIDDEKAVCPQEYVSARIAFYERLACRLLFMTEDLGTTFWLALFV